MKEKIKKLYKPEIDNDVLIIENTWYNQALEDVLEILEDENSYPQVELDIKL
jgi:hypothetical protein